MLVRAEEAIEFGCGATDLYCLAMEQGTRWVADCINWLAVALFDSQEFRPGERLWAVSLSEGGTWLGYGIFVMFITFVVGLAGGAVLQRPDVVRRTLLSTLVSLPSFYFAIFIVGEGLTIIDQASEGLMKRLTGKAGFAGMVEVIFKGSKSWDPGDIVAGSPAVPAPVGQMILVVVLMALGLFLIMCAMAFRNFVLMILVTFAPLAFVLLPAQGMSDVWMKRWMSAVVAMMLAKPLILGTLVLVMAGFKDLETIWSGEGLQLAIGVLIVSFMPMLAYGFFQFMGGGQGGDDVGSRAGASVSQKVKQVWGSTKGSFGGGRGGGVKPAPAQGRSGNSAGGASPGGESQSSSNKSGRPGQGPGGKERFEGGEKPTSKPGTSPPEKKPQVPEAPKPQPKSQPRPQGSPPQQRPSRPATPNRGAGGER